MRLVERDARSPKRLTSNKTLELYDGASVGFIESRVKLVKNKRELGNFLNKERFGIK